MRKAGRISHRYLRLLYLSYHGSGIPKALIIGLSSYHDGKRKVMRIYQNILETRQFVVNIPPSSLAETMNKLTKAYRDGFDKFKAFSLTSIPSLRVKPPSVKECTIHLECEMIAQEYSGFQHDIILGNVVATRADENLLKCKDEDRVTLMNPVYWYGVSPAYGKYYTIGSAVGNRVLDNE